MLSWYLILISTYINCEKLYNIVLYLHNIQLLNNYNCTVKGNTELFVSMVNLVLNTFNFHVQYPCLVRINHTVWLQITVKEYPIIYVFMNSWNCPFHTHSIQESVVETSLVVLKNSNSSKVIIHLFR